MLIWIASFPRSGNTYIRLLLYQLCGIRTYSIYNDPLFKKLGSEEFIGQAQLKKTKSEIEIDNNIYFIKTHELPSDNNPCIYLIRDGRDAIVSYANYTVSFERNKHLKRIKEFFGINTLHLELRKLIVNSKWGGWSNHVLNWTQYKKPEKIVVIRYEDLVIKPIESILESLDILGLNLPIIQDSISSFEELHRKWPEFFRKGEVGSWRTEMPEPLQELFWQHHGDAMRMFGYPRI